MELFIVVATGEGLGERLHSDAHFTRLSASDLSLSSFGLFVTRSVKPFTTKLYLAAVQNLTTELGLLDTMPEAPSLSRMLRGIRRIHRGEVPKSLLPITLPILGDLVEPLYAIQTLPAHGKVLLSATMLLGFMALFATAGSVHLRLPGQAFGLLSAKMCQQSCLIHQLPLQFD